MSTLERIAPGGMLARTAERGAVDGNRPRAIQAPRVLRLSSFLHVGLLALALALWAGTLAGTDVQRMSDFGLVSVLPGAYLAALAVVTVSFCVALRSPERHWALLGAHVLVLLVILHGTPAILYGTLRYAWAWKHIGIVDYILRHGSLNQGNVQFSAYQDWPAFFALVALIVHAGGFGSALAFASWAPLFNNLLFAAAAMFLFQSMTSDRRLSWLAVWIFASANWVGQDYFSPQATNYFLYLVALGICVRWLAPATAPSARVAGAWIRSERVAGALHRLITRGLAEGTARSAPPRVRPAFAGIVIVIAAAIVTSHQLTPFMLILSLAALAAFQLIAVRGMPLLVALMTATWVIYMSVGFLKGNLYWIVASIGSLNVGSSTLSNLGTASHDHVIVAEVARLLTALVAVLAAAGLVRRLRHGHVDLRAALLAAAPVLMAWGNAYGGEVLFRIYFFALPFLAFLAAGLIFPSRRSGRSWFSGFVGLAVCAALLTGMLIAYYGNERMYYFSHDEVRSAQYLVSHAPAGSMLVGLTTDYPWAFRDYERYSYQQLAALPADQRRALLSNPVGVLASLIGPGSPGYVVFSRGQEAEVEMTGELPAGSAAQVERAVSTSPRFREVYGGPDAQIFVLTHRGAG
jgi:hypothetical protein